MSRPSFRFLLVLALILACASFLPAQNLVPNPEFDQRTENWAVNYDLANLAVNSGAAEFTVVNSLSLSGTNAAKITIASAGANDYSVQFSTLNPLAFVAGKTYDIYFLAKAEAERTINVKLETIASATAPKKHYLKGNVTLTPQVKQYHLRWLCQEDAASTVLRFFLGINKATVYLDNIRIQEAPAEVLNAAQRADVETLANRLRVEYLKGSAAGASDFLSSMQADGSWTDIDYTYDSTMASWKSVKHINRLMAMSLAYSKPDDVAHQNAAMLDGISRGLNYWSVKNPKSANWWWNIIGLQQDLNKILLLLKDKLPAAVLASSVNYLNYPTIYYSGEMGGQNMVWLAAQTIHRGVVRNSLADINTGFDAIKDQAVIDSINNIQKDFSFYQHGPQIYNSGYGLGYIGDITYYMEKAQGTSFAFSGELIGNLVGLLLDGNRWMTRGQWMDQSTNGREISRPRQSTDALGLLQPIERLSNLAPSRASEMAAFKNHILGAAPHPLSGNKHFWRADYMTQLRPGYFASVKMTSSRTVGTEKGNGENIKGYWLPFGLTYIARVGDEYSDIFPVWDWTGLPGVTSPATVPTLPDGTYLSQESNFVGGASDGTYGVSAMVLNKQKTSAQKAYFFFDKEFVALGSGITSTHASAVFTTINQTLGADSMTVDGVDSTSGTQTFADSKARSFHNNIGYLILDNASGSVSLASQSGSWSSINTAQSSAPLSKNVFTMRIAHGTNPENAKYAYAVVPDITKSAFESYAQAPGIRVVSNTNSIQAVYKPAEAIYEAVFYQAGSVKFDTALTLDVDQPCIVIVRNSGSGVVATVSNPLATAVSVKVGLQVASKARVETVFELPGEQWAGSSVSHSVAVSLPTTGITFLAAAKEEPPKANKPAVSTTGASSPSGIDGVVSVNDDAFTYSGIWFAAAEDKLSSGKYEGDDHYSGIKGASFEVKFTGTQVKIYGTVDTHHGSALVSVDGSDPVTVSWKAPVRKNSELLWTSPILAAKEHVLKVVVVGDATVTADRVDYTGAKVVPVPAAAQESNMVKNGEFSEAFGETKGGSKIYGSWTVNDCTATFSPEGANGTKGAVIVDKNGGIYGSIEQNFSFEPGVNYVVTFYAKVANASDAGKYRIRPVMGKAIGVTDGALISSFSNTEANTLTSDWKKYTFEFTSSDAAMKRIQFKTTDQEKDAYQKIKYLIDEVSLTKKLPVTPAK